jgi:hypothetical protein
MHGTIDPVMVSLPLGGVRLASLRFQSFLLIGFWMISSIDNHRMEIGSAAKRKSECDRKSVVLPHFDVRRAPIRAET